MAVNLTSYGGLKAGVQQWMARPGDTLLDERFDDHLIGAETRIYYGYATDNPSDPLHSEPLRIPEMETVDAAFALSASTVPQPDGFLELISAFINTSTPGPLQIVAQRTLDAYGTQALGGVKLIAVSGTNFRVKDEPDPSDTATLRFYKKLATPTAEAGNAILTAYPMTYLYACLFEATTMTREPEAATLYLQMYNAQVAGLNSRTQRINASANPVMRLRAGMMP